MTKQEIFKELSRLYWINNKEFINREWKKGQEFEKGYNLANIHTISYILRLLEKLEK